MKIIRILLGIILVLVIIIVFGSFLLPKHVRVERAIKVAVPASVAYKYVLDFDKFNEWSPWYAMEPSAKVTISGPKEAIGSTYAWVGKEVGIGNFVVTRLKPFTEIDQQLNFEKPFEAAAQNNFLFNQEGDSTKVTWIYDGENKGIMDKWMGLMMDGMLGKDYEKGLKQLKTNLEK